MATLMILFAKYLYIVIIVLSILYIFLQQRHLQKKILVFAICILPLSLLIGKLLSLLYYHPRPFVSEHFAPLISHAANNGFPSDHALLGFTLSSLIFIFHKKLGLFLGILSLLVGVSRIYVGIHYPVDILASFMVGVVVSYGVYFFSPYERITKKS